MRRVNARPRLDEAGVVVVAAGRQDMILSSRALVLGVKTMNGQPRRAEDRELDGHLAGGIGAAMDKDRSIAVTRSWAASGDVRMEKATLPQIPHISGTSRSWQFGAATNKVDSQRFY